MRIAISHHYWEDGVNAGWHPGSFPVPSIKGAIENDYLELGSSRPQWREYGAWTVFFAYRDARDFDNRPIVNISCAFVQDCADADAWAQIINPLLNRVSSKASSLDVPQLELKKKKARGWRICLAGCIMLLIIVFTYWMVFHEKSEKERPPQAELIARTPHTADTHKSVQESTQILEEKGKIETSFRSAWCDDNELKSDLRLCYKNFLVEYCNANELPSYEEWRKSCKSAQSFQEIKSSTAPERILFKNSEKMNRDVLMKEVEKIFSQ